MENSELQNLKFKHIIYMYMKLTLEVTVCAFAHTQAE